MEQPIECEFFTVGGVKIDLERTTLAKIRYATTLRVCRACGQPIPIDYLLYGDWRRRPVYCPGHSRSTVVKRAYANVDEERAAGLYQPCPQCGTEVFKGYSGRRKFCNKECAKTFHKGVYTARRKQAALDYKAWRAGIVAEAKALSNNASLTMGESVKLLESVGKLPERPRA